MRATYRFGGICVAALLALAGCSSDDETPGDAGGNAAGGAGANGGGGGRAGAGGYSGDAAASDSSAQTGGARVDGGSADAPAADAARDAVAGDGSGPTAHDGSADAHHASDANPPPRDGASDGPKHEGGALADAKQAADGGDGGPSIDAAVGSCRITASGGGQCEVIQPFETKSTALDTVVLGTLTLTSCPDGANNTTGVCVGMGSFTNAHWTASTDGRALEGTIGLRADDITARVAAGSTSAVCHLSIGSHAYVPVRVRITLPQGTPAAGFIPGCSEVLSPQITLVDEIPYSVNESVTCQAAAAAAQAVGGLDSLNEGVQKLIATALTARACIVR